MTWRFISTRRSGNDYADSVKITPTKGILDCEFRLQTRVRGQHRSSSERASQLGQPLTRGNCQSRRGRDAVCRRTRKGHLKYLQLINITVLIIAYVVFIHNFVCPSIAGVLWPMPLNPSLDGITTAVRTEFPHTLRFFDELMIQKHANNSPRALRRVKRVISKSEWRDRMIHQQIDNPRT